MDRERIIRWIRKLRAIEQDPRADKYVADRAAEVATRLKAEYEIPESAIQSALPLEARNPTEDEIFLVNRSFGAKNSDGRSQYQRRERYITMTLSPDATALMHQNGWFGFIEHIIDRHLVEAERILVDWLRWLLARVEGAPALYRDQPATYLGMPVRALPEEVEVGGDEVYIVEEPKGEEYSMIAWVGGTNEEAGHAARVDIASLVREAHSKIYAFRAEIERRKVKRQKIYGAKEPALPTTVKADVDAT